jgi:type IV secretion system protein VirB1
MRFRVFCGLLMCAVALAAGPTHAGPTLSAAEFTQVAQQCAPHVDVMTLAALVRTESGYNPYAIGVVGARLARQPVSMEEAQATVQMLEQRGYDFSLGLAQINRRNLARLGETTATVLDPCRNLAASQRILRECFTRATRSTSIEQQALRHALSCYYSGGFSVGYREGYVSRVVANAQAIVPPIDVAPARAQPIPLAEPSRRIQATAAPMLSPAPSPSSTRPIPSSAGCTAGRQVMLVSCGRVTCVRCLGH